jgi:hypothetical protein
LWQHWAQNLPPPKKTPTATLFEGFLARQTQQHLYPAIIYGSGSFLHLLLLLIENIGVCYLLKML